MYGAIFPSNIFLIAFLLHNLSTCRAIIDLDSTMKYFNSPKFSLAMKYFKDDFTKFVRSIASEVATSVASRAKELYDNMDAYDNEILTGSYMFEKRARMQPKEKRIHEGHSKVETDDSSSEIEQTPELGEESTSEATLSANTSRSLDNKEAKSYLNKTSNNVIQEEKLSKLESVPRHLVDHQKVSKNSTRIHYTKQQVHSPVTANPSDIENSKLRTLNAKEQQPKVEMKQNHDRIAWINPLIQDMMKRKERVQPKKIGSDIKTNVSHPSNHQSSKAESLHGKMQVMPKIVTNESHDSKLGGNKQIGPDILDFVNPEIINYIKRNRLDQTTAKTTRVEDVNRTAYERPKPSNTSILNNSSKLTQTKKHLGSLRSGAQIAKSKTDQRDNTQIPLGTTHFVKPEIVQVTGQSTDAHYLEQGFTMRGTEGLRKLGKTSRRHNTTLQRELHPSTMIQETYRERERVTEIPTAAFIINAVTEEEPKFQAESLSPESIIIEDLARAGADRERVTAMKSINLDLNHSKSTIRVVEHSESPEREEKLIMQQKGGESENERLPESETADSFLSNDPMYEREHVSSAESISSKIFTRIPIIDTLQNNLGPTSKGSGGNFRAHENIAILKAVTATNDKQTTFSEGQETRDSTSGERQIIPLENLKLSKENVSGKTELIIDDVRKSPNFTVDLPNFPDFEPEMEKIEINSEPKLGVLDGYFRQKNAAMINYKSLIGRSEKIGSEIGIKLENSEARTQTSQVSKHFASEFFSPTQYKEDDSVETSSSFTKEKEIFDVSSSPIGFARTDSAEGSLTISQNGDTMEREEVIEKFDAVVGKDTLQGLQAFEGKKKIYAEPNSTSTTVLLSMFQDEVNKKNVPSGDTSFIQSTIENGDTLSTSLNGGKDATESHGLMSSTSKIMIRKGTPNYRYSARPHRVLPKSRIRKRAAKDTFMNIIETRWSEINNEEAEYEEMSTDDAHYDEHVEHEMTERYRCPHTDDLEDEDPPRGPSVRTDEDISLRKQTYKSEPSVQEGVFAKLSEICATLNSVGHKNKTKMIFFEQPVAREKIRSTTLNLLPKLKRSFKEKGNKTRKNVTEGPRKWNKKSESSIDLEAESDRLLDMALGKFEDKLKSIIQSNWPRRNVRDPTQTIHHSQLKRPTNGTSKMNQTFDGNHTTDMRQSGQPLIETVDEVDGIVREEVVSSTETSSVPPQDIYKNKEGATGSDEQPKSTLSQNKTTKSPLDAESIDERRRALTYSTAQRGESIRLNNTKVLQGKKEESLISTNNLEHQAENEFLNCSSCATESTSVDDGIDQTEDFTINRLNEFNTNILKYFSANDRSFDRNQPQYSKLQLPITAIKYSDPIRYSASAILQPSKSKEISGNEEIKEDPEDVSIESADSSQSNFKDGNGTMSTFVDTDGQKSRILTRTYANKDNIMRLNRKLEKITLTPGDASITYFENPQNLQKSIENFKKIAKLNWELLKNIEADESFSISEFNASALDSPPSSTEFTENLHLHTSEFNEEEDATPSVKDTLNKTRKIILPLKARPQKLRLHVSQAELQSNKQYHQMDQKYSNNGNASFETRHNSTEDGSKTGDFVREDMSQSHDIIQNKNSFQTNGPQKIVADSHGCSKMTTQGKCNPDKEVFFRNHQLPKSTEEQQETESDHVLTPNDNTDEEMDAEFLIHQQKPKLDETLFLDHNLDPGNLIQQDSWTLDKNHDHRNGSVFAEFKHENETNISEQNRRKAQFVDSNFSTHQGGFGSEQLENPESTMQQEQVPGEIDSQEADSLTTTEESADNDDSTFVKLSSEQTTSVGVMETDSTSPPGNNLPLKNGKLVSHHSSSLKKGTLTPNFDLNMLQSFVSSPVGERLEAVSKHWNRTKFNDGNIVTLRMSQQLELKATPAQIEQIRKGLTKSINLTDGRRVTTNKPPNLHSTSDLQSHGAAQYMETLHHKSPDAKHHRIDKVNSLQYHDTRNFTKEPSLKEAFDNAQTPKESSTRYQNEGFGYNATKNLRSRPTGLKQRAKQIKIGGTDHDFKVEKFASHRSFTTDRDTDNLQEDSKATEAGSQTDERTSYSPSPKKQRGKSKGDAGDLQEDSRATEARSLTDEPSFYRPSQKKQKGKSTGHHRYKVLELPELQTTATLTIHTTDDPSNQQSSTPWETTENSQSEHNTFAARYQTDEPPTSNPLKVRQKGRRTGPHRYMTPEQLRQQIIITVMEPTTTESKIMTEKLYAEESKKHKSLVTGRLHGDMASFRQTVRRKNKEEKIERHQSTYLPFAEMQRVTAVANEYSAEPSHQRNPTTRHVRVDFRKGKEEPHDEQSEDESSHERNFQNRKRGKQRQLYDRKKPRLYGEHAFAVSLTEGKTVAGTLTPLRGTSTLRTRKALSSERDDTETEFRSSSLEDKRGRASQGRDRKAKRRRLTRLRSFDLNDDE